MMALPHTVPPMGRVRTPGFAHHSLAFSPFYDGKFALASGANFGLVGNGRVEICSLGGPGGGITIERGFDTQDSVYDVAWNEAHENQVLAACGNGSIRLFDITLQGLPVQAWHEHHAEVVCADWSNIEKRMFATASWDGVAKVWLTDRTIALVTLPRLPTQLYASLWSPHTNQLLTVGQDPTVRIYDIRSPQQAAQSFLACPIPGADVLSADWNKYKPGIVATAGKDRVVRVWDLRNTNQPVAELGRHGGGHSLAVRKVQWSPHHADVLASCGYDMSTRVWDVQQQRAIATMGDHTEFCMALGWALFEEGVIATGGWDQYVNVYKPL